MEKDFDRWNVEKQKLNANSWKRFYHEGEIWWCSFGINVGDEQVGIIQDREASIVLSQVRTFDAKRLGIKIATLDSATFEKLKSALYQTLLK